ncbi:MAG: imidazole glycerol phosphate synthase subunit HisH [Oscillospiraceae bacterium]|nr:imidazole glycerol phosphate synthase subunit HisH [Oscillospiraceae bacterium]
MIGIIDYKAGNSVSVKNACDKIGVDAVLITSAQELQTVDSVILPGVGSAEETMSSLKELDLVAALEDFVFAQKKPYLGICVGMQVLFEFSEEGNTKCLGWLQGEVKKFDSTLVRIPQIGWNNILWAKQSALKNRLAEDNYFYFVNSYFVMPKNKSDILATAVYGQEFTAMVEHENIYASQFHIEKSGEIGLQILKNFSLLSGGDLN